MVLIILILVFLLIYFFITNGDNYTEGEWNDVLRKHYDKKKWEEYSNSEQFKRDELAEKKRLKEKKDE